MAGRRGAARLVISAAVSGSLMLGGLSGCASGDSMFSAGVDKSDACGEQHAKFADSKSYYLQKVAQGAILGAMGGAALGALSAVATGGSIGQGAATGAVGGAVVGGAAGAADAQQQQANDEAAAANALYGDIDHAAQELDRTTTTFVLLRDCRFAVAQRIKASVKQGTVSRDDGTKQLADQRKRFDEEVALARQYGTKMADQDQQFRTASGKLVDQDSEAQSYMKTRGKRLEAAKHFAPDYVVAADVSLRAEPNADSDEVAGLDKGQAVQLDAEGSSGGWRQVIVEDGRSGYVKSRSIKRKPAEKAAKAKSKGKKAKAAEPEATADATPAPVTRAATPKPPLDTSNPEVKAAVAATETIPEKRDAYNKSVDDAVQQSNLSFNIDQAAPAT